MSKRLDARQEAEENILEAISTWHTTYGIPPTFREIAETTNIPLGTTHAIVRVLREEGKLVFTDHISRSIRLIQGA